MIMYKYNVGELSTNNAEFAQLWVDIRREAEQKQREWNKELISQGYKMAMPNDGWVDRENNTFIVAYPYFQNGDLEVGDKVMLGWHDDKDNQRAVVITFKEPIIFEPITRYYFKDA